MFGPSIGQILPMLDLGFSTVMFLCLLIVPNVFCRIFNRNISFSVNSYQVWSKYYHGNVLVTVNKIKYLFKVSQ